MTQAIVNQICQGTSPWTSQQMTYSHQTVDHPVRDGLTFAVTLALLSAFTIVTIVTVINTVTPH